ncbi:MAG TPA: phosphoenolpyruvate carboxykinase (ATP), partial [Candidatus Nitrosocosmicus sp.]|nr:phosphoenolpyruvate carboxykinase (ATP) [Candidatus Nitrosocosmicus sp.]
MDFTINEGRRNLPVPLLVEAALLNNEGQLSTTGSLSVRTGKFTGRSPDDKFIVRDEITANTVDWGKINHPISEEHFDKILARMNIFISENRLEETLYTFDGYVGADRSLRLPIRVITDKAWHCLFATQIFIRATQNELFNFR